MHQQQHDRACGTEAIGGNHFGPVMVYMSKVEDAATADGSDPWFKVSEFGYDAGNKTWGTDMLNQNCGRHTFTIPSKIPAGDYLIRAEAIALHTASQLGGAQMYMSCYVSQPRRPPGGNRGRAQLTISSSCSKSSSHRAAISCRQASHCLELTRPPTPAFRSISGATISSHTSSQDLM